MISATMLGLSRRQVRERFDSILTFAELKEFADLQLKNFSSGMKVRLAFSIAIQVDAEVLLFDEVLAVGDASFREKCFAEFERMKGRSTILLVTHSMPMVERFCDRAVLIEQGRIVAEGAPGMGRPALLRGERGAALSEHRQRGGACRPALPRRRSPQPCADGVG